VIDKLIESIARGWKTGVVAVAVAGGDDCVSAERDRHEGIPGDVGIPGIRRVGDGEGLRQKRGHQVERVPIRLDIAGEVQMDRGIARFADGVSDYRPIWRCWRRISTRSKRTSSRPRARRAGRGGRSCSVDGGVEGTALSGEADSGADGGPGGSLTQPNHPMGVKIEERKTLTLGSRVPYAIYHQSVAPRKRLPRRPEIMLTEAFKRTAMHHMQVYLVEMASKMGFRTGGTPGARGGTRRRRGRARSCCRGGQCEQGRGPGIGAGTDPDEARINGRSD